MDGQKSELVTWFLCSKWLCHNINHYILGSVESHEEDAPVSSFLTISTLIPLALHVSMLVDETVNMRQDTDWSEKY